MADRQYRQLKKIFSPKYAPDVFGPGSNRTCSNGMAPSADQELAAAAELPRADVYYSKSAHPRSLERPEASGNRDLLRTLVDKQRTPPTVNAGLLVPYY